MTEDGKISRALNKSGRSEESGSASPSEASGRVAQAYEFIGEEGRPFPIERLSGRAGPPDPSVVMVHDRRGEAAAQVRALRDKIAAKEGSIQVITMTSGTREEGKTTLAVNLAAALAETASRPAVLLDGDVRGPAVHLLTGLERAGGLGAILRSDNELDGRICTTQIPGVDVICAFPWESLDGSAGMLARRSPELLRKLRRHYSYVLIDTPPVIASSEARIFGKHSDGAILVARLEKTPREVVKRALGELRDSKVEVLGCVLTHRKHHVPNFIYRLFGNTPSYYYDYYHGRGRRKKSEQPEQQDKR